MKIVVTGSLGNIGKPLTRELVQNGHSVIVISSKTERQKDIEALGAKAAIGSIENADFLTSTFAGADIVYLMEPPANPFDHNINIIAYNVQLANIYLQAIERSGVKHIVHLSSIGAHTDKGVGTLAFHYNVENILKQLSNDVSIKFIRPVGFYSNMLAFIQTIKTQGAIVQNYGENDKEPWVSPSDIATAIAEEMEKPFNGRTIRYIASDEVSPNEVTKILGEAIGKSDLKWLVVSDEQLLNGMIATGLNPQAARGFVEMNSGRRDGKLYEDFYNHKPTLGKIKLKDFAKEFAVAYNQ